MTNEDLTRLYNEANGIPEGKALLREDVVEMRFKIQDACRAYDAGLAK